ncbi:ParB/RepB/Spo0J family partition protein [Zhihengliuella halotolerans]|uniref:ParB/RepB/Spo0J family partition protein n=1 Tax=Zhihengliuella halotolerans TaxID=370736 RepID=UPI000C80702B|nr:ParB/RepB/Spo0J family partition protein [Zhihengliuella halotolerans]
MAEKRRGLGRGLGALISSSPTADTGQDGPGAGEGGDNRPADSSTKTSTQRAPKQAAKPSSGTGKGPAPEGVAGPAGRPEASKGPSTTSSVRRPSRSPEEGEARVSTPDPAKAAGKAGAVARTKARPVDMFFTPGRTADADDDGSNGSSSSTRTAPSRGGRRPAMPDVIGQARSRSATSAADAVEGESQVAESKDEPSLVPVPGATFAELSVAAIHPNRKQPRQVFDEEDMDELVHSIKEIGLLQPIVVRPSTESGDAEYELVMGERRWRATQQAGLDTIPAIVRMTTDEDLLRDALLENLHRSQLNPLEEAAAYQQLLGEFGCTQEELSERIGRSRPQISNTIRLMKLPALVQRRVAAGVISQGHARALLALADPAEIERLAQRIVSEGLSVRATEELVAMNEGVEKKRRETKPRSTARHERLDYLANSLSDRLDTSVKISLGAKKGRVAIEFASVDDLNRIMALISPDGDK